MPKRIVFIDYIRVIACFLVMLVHSSENFYCYTADTSMLANESNRLWVAIFDGAFGRISVPLFMIVSAFLLVPTTSSENKGTLSMTDFYKRRFMRILPPMLVFMVLYCFMPLLWGGLTCEQAWTDFTHLPFTFPSSAGHLWFMYPLISLYLVIPIVSPWLQTASAKDERLFLAFFALSTLVPWLTRFVSADLWGTCFWNPYFGMLYYCSGYLGYLVLAHYIREHLTWNCSRRMTVGAMAFVAGGAFTAWSFWHTGVPGVEMPTPTLEWAWEFCSPSVLTATFGAFLMFTCIDQTSAPSHLLDSASADKSEATIRRGSGPAARVIEGIARLTFGMYLMHILVLSNIAPLFIPHGPANPIWPVYLTIPCMALLTFIGSAAITKLLTFIPGSKWIIG